MNLEKQILDDIAQQLSDQVDREVLKGMGIHKDVQLVCSTGTVYGLPYHTVEPKNLEWQDTRRMWDDMTLWCCNQFGQSSSIWQETKELNPGYNKRWYANDRKFWFQNEADQLMFVLRWS